MKEKFLIQNSVICLACGEKLVSNHQHDYVSCNCNNGTFCDGGVSYQRFGGKNMDLIKQDSVYSDADFEIVRKVLLRGGRGVNGDEELKYVALQEINDDWLEAIIDYETELRPNSRYLPFYKQEKLWRKKEHI